jgi:DNA-binding beta-propeller fold protein YncE
MKPLSLKIFAPVLLLLLLVSATLSWGEGKDRGVMRVEFLYAIESTGGRGERLQAPQDIFYDRQADELYIADAGNRGIFVYNNNGAFLQKIVVDGKEGSPTMVATDREGLLYVGHNRSAKVSIFNYRGEFLDALELPGVVDLPGNTVRPMYFADGPHGEVYALESKGKMVKIDPFGEKHEIFSPTGENAPNVIYGMTVDSRGRFLFSDMRPYSVVIYDPEKKEFQRFGSAGILYGQLARPQGVAADETGHIFVTSLVRNKVLCYDQEGNFIEEFGGIGKAYGRFYMPGKIVSDGKDRIYVLEPPLKRVQVFRISFPGEKKEISMQEGPLNRG